MLLTLGLHHHYCRHQIVHFLVRQKEECVHNHVVDNAQAEVAYFRHRRAEVPPLMEKYWCSLLRLWQKKVRLLLGPTMDDAMTEIDELQEEVEEAGHIQGDDNGEVVACDHN